MIETNIKLIEGGTNLNIETRCVVVNSQDHSPRLMQKVCKLIGKKYGLAAIPNSLAHSHNEVLVFSRNFVLNSKFEGDDWIVQVEDLNKVISLSFANHFHRLLISQLIEKVFNIDIHKLKQFWTLDSPRIFYEEKPFITINDISAFRRFHVSVINVASNGIGVTTDVSTAFFTNLSVADYFKNGRIDSHNENPRVRFEKLGQRQIGQKGTLVYDISYNRLKCYFEGFEYNQQCSTTGILKIQGNTYDSVYDYYKKERPNLHVKEDDSVAKVCFPGLHKPACVAAKLLKLRVMNNVLPRSFNNVDKIPPSERRYLIQNFWNQISSQIKLHGITVSNQFWLPTKNNTLQVQLPILKFAKDRKLTSPQPGNFKAYKEYFYKRLGFLNEVGCLYVPSTIDRKIHFAIPQKLDNKIKNQFINDITSYITRWTGKDFNCEEILYSNFQEVIHHYQTQNNPGLIIFVFEDNDPATYFNISYELKSWRIKRIKIKTLENRSKILQKSGATLFEDKLSKDWNSFIEMNSLKILLLLDCIPWSLDEKLNYEAQLIIDVGENRRYFALSLLIIQFGNTKLPLYIDSLTCPKPDVEKEEINKDILKDKIIELFNRVPIGRINSINSLLILRDGHECGDEVEGIELAKTEITKLKILNDNAKFDIVDFHKHSSKNIRFWKQINNHKIVNALEGNAIKLDESTFILQNTGSATIPKFKSKEQNSKFSGKDLKKQGTAEPMMIKTRSEGVDMFQVVSDITAVAQLNYTSPKVAQRLPFPMKRTDDELNRRLSQEIKRIK